MIPQSSTDADAPIGYDHDELDVDFGDARSRKLLLIAHATTLVGETLSQADLSEFDEPDRTQALVDEHVNPALEVAVEISDHADDPAFRDDVTTLDNDLLEAARKDLAPLGPPLCGIDVGLPGGTPELTIDDFTLDIGWRGS